MTLSRRSVLAAGLAMLAAPAGAETTPRLRRLSPRLDRMIAPGTEPEVIATGIRWAEGPLWVPRGGYLLFSDPPANIVRRWQHGRAVSVVLDPSGAPGTDPTLVREPGANGLALDRDGALLIANSGGRSIDRVDLTTGRRTVLADRHAGKRFNSPNDLHVARDGTIWFTDPPYGLKDGDTSPLKEQTVNGVYRRRPDGRIDLIDGELTRPNGIALSPDERRLYVSVSDEAAPRIMVYDLDARGMARGRRVLLDARSMLAAGGAGLPDGMKVAHDGTLVCSVPGGMMLMTPEAEPLGLIEQDAPIANCAFGEGGRALFLAANDRILRVALRPGWQG
ncbi:gluconolactonase [Sphingomonas sp. SORGH_AS870]|uniref:SMP-30/gluconolactonase/LRE family protein n=1 Tax=Sphingomonas sp. SORGH_AS_0870 TaxID=3041801 RepID=UPI0028678A54|nr:SMP-30/gluconolactonase/LRE family protein [Sphingomonas sp. SORGH_AS_0870]MDR6145957.1 gluconolactonase [Sphingomonas sp. SORGH_AS_0870]